VVQAPGGPEEDTSDGFAYGGWVWPYYDDAGEDAMGGAFKRPFELVLGRRTYDIFAAYWPHVPEGAPLLYLNSLMNVAFALNMDSFVRKHGIGSGAEWSVRVDKLAP